MSLGIAESSFMEQSITVLVLIVSLIVGVAAFTRWYFKKDRYRYTAKRKNELHDRGNSIG